MGEGYSICSNKGLYSISRGDYYEIAKIHSQIFKIFSPEPQGQFQTKLSTKHLCIKGIQTIQIKVHILLEEEIITKGKNTLTELENLLPLDQFQLNLAKSNVGYRGFKVVQTKGPALFKGEIITKFRKIH